MTQGPLRRSLAVVGVSARLGVKLPKLVDGAVGNVLWDVDGRKITTPIGGSVDGGKPFSFNAVIETSEVPLARDIQSRMAVRWFKSGVWLMEVRGVETRPMKGPKKRWVNRKHPDDSYISQTPAGSWSFGVAVPGSEIDHSEFLDAYHSRLHQIRSPKAKFE